MTIYERRRYRVRLAFVLAWAALRGRTVDIDVSWSDGEHRYTGIPR